MFGACSNKSQHSNQSASAISLCMADLRNKASTRSAAKLSSSVNGIVLAVEQEDQMHTLGPQLVVCFIFSQGFVCILRRGSVILGILNVRYQGSMERFLRSKLLFLPEVYICGTDVNILSLRNIRLQHQSGSRV